MAQLYDFPLGISKLDPNFEKILHKIADFRGYETLDSLRASDGQVRRWLGGLLGDAMDEAKNARKKLADGTHLRVLTDFDRMSGHIRMCQERMLRPETKKLAACHLYRPTKNLVGELYALDFQMLTAADNVYNLMQEFQRMAHEDMMLTNIHKIDVSLEGVASSIDKKDEIISCMIE